nr:acyl-CoA dehydrogenase family protein [Gordonia sp. LAM0048]
MADDVEHDRATLKALYDAGWSRHGWPTEVGGLGGDERHRAAMYDTLAHAGVELPEAFVILETLGPVLTHYAPELAERHLGRYLRGEELWAQGFSEPEAGSDLAALRTAARRTGSGFRLSGQKIWSTLGQFADHALVLARTGDRDTPSRTAMTMFWVDLHATGVSTSPIRSSNGRDEFAQMTFDDVDIEDSHAVGGLGNGWEVAMYLLQYERGMYAWLRQSVLRRRLDEVIDIGARRPASGGSDRELGSAYLAVSALRNRTRNTVSDLAAGATLGPEVCVDKVLLSRAEHATFDCARRILGTDFLYPAADSGIATSRWQSEWFYSRATSIFGGAVEVQHDTIAKHVLRLPSSRRRGTGEH